jgi:regulatory protein
MVKITKISLQKNQKRFNIFLDGKYSFSLSEESLVDSHLAVGQEFDEGKVKELISKSEFQKILDKALRFVSLRPRSVSEMKQYLGFKLKGKEESGFLIEKVVDRLIGSKFLDDEVFAKWWIEQRATFRPRDRKSVV